MRHYDFDGDRLRDIIETHRRCDQIPTREAVLKQFRFETGREPETSTSVNRILERLHLDAEPFKAVSL